MSKTCTKNLTGKVFDRLTVIKFIPDKSAYSKWLCQCSCGNEKITFTQALINGLTKSCGCLKKESDNKPVSHGHSGKNRTKTYNSWAGMMDRCEWGGHPTYANYGAKGIRVCERWHSYENFLADMGERPLKTSIDRIDNNLGYSPDNCRWATAHIQNLNRSVTVKVKINNNPIIVYNLCNELGLSKKAVRARASRRGNDYVAALRSMGIQCDYL